MRKLSITIAAIALALGSSGAFAFGKCCNFGPVTHGSDGAYSGAGGGAFNSSVSYSSTRGNGISINKGFSSSSVQVSGYAYDYGSQSYNAGVDAKTKTSTGAFSLNLGNAQGFSWNEASASAGGYAGGYADSHTHPHLFTHSRDAEAYASGGGQINLFSNSIAVSGGPGLSYGLNFSGASAGAHFWGNAETTQNSFWANADDLKYTKTYSVGLGQSAGEAGAEANGGGIAEGWTGQDVD